MAQYFQIHPENPQPRLIRRAVDIIRNGGVIIYPTDSSYAFGCHMAEKQALDRIRRIRRLDDRHNFTLVGKDVAQISNFANISNDAFRLVKSVTPGPFTFIFKATREVPRRLQHPKRKSVGVRIPNHPVAQSLLDELGEPMFSSTLILPGDLEAFTDPVDIRERMEHEVELIIDSGTVAYTPTTMVDLSGKNPELIREGKGDLSAILQF
ncbi:MAG: threonylcarbamoyl-AMP synthase [Methylococcaceae bacterium]|nr:threonylcarbamoyl-AMP synthase [Methylococcaceae bacterium]